MFSKNEYLSVKHTLRFRQDGTFRILFLTDIHAGVGMSVQTKPGVDAIIRYARPDMVLIGGDTFGCRIGVTQPEQVSEYLNLLTEVLEEKQIPWAHVYGNHDDNLGVSKEIQQEIYESYPYCVSKRGEKDIAGVGNYVLPVLRSDSDEVALNIWALDSHDSMPGIDQVNWYYQTSRAIEDCFGRKIPSIMYLHIPLPEYCYVIEHPEECGTKGTVTGGFDREWENSGLFQACVERGDVKGIFCGHEHFHDMSGTYKGIRLSFDASCGYDAGSDNKLRGGRIIEFSEENPGEMKTWMIHLRDICGVKAIAWPSRLLNGPEEADRKDYAIYADVFYGNEKRLLPKPEGIAGKWKPADVSTGATTPAVTLPFGGLSVERFGQDSGKNQNNADFKNLGEGVECMGFSYVQAKANEEGSSFFHCPMVTPCYDEIRESTIGCGMKWESGAPGFYKTDLKKPNNVLCEVVIAPDVMCHSYTYRRENGLLVVDFSDGRRTGNAEGFPTERKETRLRLCGETAFEAELVLEGRRLCFYGYCGNAQKAALWRDDTELAGETEYMTGRTERRFGVCFSAFNDREVELRLSVSADSVEAAREAVLSETRSMKEIALAAYRTWDRILGRIEAEASAEWEKRLFYTNLYHSLIYPSDWSRERCVYEKKSDFIAELMLRGAGKAQLPLLYILYPEISEKLVPLLIEYYREEEEADRRQSSDSACGKREWAEKQKVFTAVKASIYDAYVHGVKAEYPAELCEAPDAICSGILPRNMDILDQYFGYADKEETASQEAGNHIGRFSGFSDIRDMEAPVAYYYAGRHDRMCEMIDAGMRCMFTEGRNGLPGDNHLGALSSLYVWYAMGLLPVPGQDKLVLGTPHVCTVTLYLANGREFTVSREGEGIYVAEAFLNGRVLSDFSIKASDMMRGGTLRLVMKENGL